MDVSPAALYQIALSRVPQVGPVLARNLLAYCGSAEAIFRASSRELCRIPGIGYRTAAQLKRPEPLREAEQELDYVAKRSIQVHFFSDVGLYPQRLRVYPDAPVVLYSKGDFDPNPVRTVAIVGTRQPSDAGRAITEQLVSELAAWNCLVVSGLAYGIDVVAHRQALQSGLQTLGILGHGLSRIYPAEHRSVAQQMLEQGGLMTEFISWLPPEREHFPMRNRIVAGMADALIVVETGKQGGSIITAKLGNDYNKEVMAVPGAPGNPKSEGCNWLIKTHRAHLIESAADIAYLLGWEQPEAPSNPQLVLFSDLTESEQLIVEALQTGRRLNVDELLLKTQLPQSVLIANLLELECRNLIRTWPGAFYELRR